MHSLLEVQARSAYPEDVKPTSFLSIVRGRLPRRLSTLLLAAALLLSAGGDAVGQSACPHHDAPRQEGTSSVESGEHAGRHGHTADADAPRSEPRGGHDSPCTCIGTCHVTSATPLPPHDGEVASPCTLLLETAIVPSADEVGVARILLRLLPFANGPPRLA